MRKYPPPLVPNTESTAPGSRPIDTAPSPSPYQLAHPPPVPQLTKVGVMDGFSGGVGLMGSERDKKRWWSVGPLAVFSFFLLYLPSFWFTRKSYAEVILKQTSNGFSSSPLSMCISFLFSIPQGRYMSTQKASTTYLGNGPAYPRRALGSNPTHGEEKTFQFSAATPPSCGGSAICILAQSQINRSSTTIANSCARGEILGNYARKELPKD